MIRPDGNLPVELTAQLKNEAAFSDLENPNSSGVDIENALAVMGGIKAGGARRFLRLASQRISNWIVTTGEIGVVFETIKPHLNTLKQEAEEDPSKREEFKGFSTSMLSESLAASPSSYEQYFRI